MNFHRMTNGLVATANWTISKNVEKKFFFPQNSFNFFVIAWKATYTVRRRREAALRNWCTTVLRLWAVRWCAIKIQKRWWAVASRICKRHTTSLSTGIFECLFGGFQFFLLLLLCESLLFFLLFLNQTNRKRTKVIEWQKHIQIQNILTYQIGHLFFCVFCLESKIRLLQFNFQPFGYFYGMLSIFSAQLWVELFRKNNKIN